MLSVSASTWSPIRTAFHWNCPFQCGNFLHGNIKFLRKSRINASLFFLALLKGSHLIRTIRLDIWLPSFWNTSYLATNILSLQIHCRLALESTCFRFQRPKRFKTLHSQSMIKFERIQGNQRNYRFYSKNSLTLMAMWSSWVFIRCILVQHIMSHHLTFIFRMTHEFCDLFQAKILSLFTWSLFGISAAMLFIQLEIVE